MTGISTNRARRNPLIWPDPPEQSGLRRCDYPGCDQHGEYRAPKARDRLRDYFWFCLDHVRAYNAAWNYFSGMSADEIDAQMRRDFIWDRPTWPLGQTPDAHQQEQIRRQFHDEFHGPDDDEDHGEVDPQADFKELKALKLFGLEPPASMAAVKARYKDLAKQLHPDITGGDHWSEERLKMINQAYQVLKLAYAG